MEADDFFRRQEFMKNALNSKKKSPLFVDHKKKIVAADMGHQALKFLKTGVFLKSLSTLTKEEIETAYQGATDMGHQALKFLKTGVFLKSLSTLTKEEIETAYQEASNHASDTKAKSRLTAPGDPNLLRRFTVRWCSNGLLTTNENSCSPLPMWLLCSQKHERI
ncbi:hypothetical protein CVT26_004935 [Gymnopilus dilepis]|uniref:Uncharacterized protein n=1 Tax=Gymnopilus dilepis TaxID=231916 RepID=A0A409YIY5_9AGAR|nr:hypothetical protein CVT26_004935 [Gymnopilus dilepis]